METGKENKDAKICVARKIGCSSFNWFNIFFVLL